MHGTYFLFGARSVGKNSLGVTLSMSNKSTREQSLILIVHLVAWISHHGWCGHPKLMPMPMTHGVTLEHYGFMCEASWVFRHPTKMWVCTPSKLATMIICYMLERRASRKEMNIVSSRHWCFLSSLWT